MTTHVTTRPMAVSIGHDFVLSKCDYFLDMQLWPKKTKLNPEGWLENFQSDEMDAAVHLLNGFVYYSNELIKQLFFVAFQGLSMRIVADQPYCDAIEKWQKFVDSLAVTRVIGEIPNDTDSGFIFQRMARQVLRLPESQVMSPIEVAEQVKNGSISRVIFVDDFVGSGNQFIETWNKSINAESGNTSFNMLANSLRNVEFIYCPLVCTEYGMGEIRASCRGVEIAPVHVLPSRYSALASDSIFWPPELANKGPDFVRDASNRAGIPDTDWRGFHQLGLALAFEHGIPDATLPLFYWQENGWRPLLERT